MDKNKKYKWWVSECSKWCFWNWQLILWTLDISWLNITWYWTQYKKNKAKILFRPRTHKRHPCLYPRAMECLFWVVWRKDTARYWEHTVLLFLNKGVIIFNINITVMLHQCLGISNHWQLHCLFIKAKHCWSLCEGNPLVIFGFFSQRAS